MRWFLRRFLVWFMMVNDGIIFRNLKYSMTLVLWCWILCNSSWLCVWDIVKRFDEELFYILNSDDVSGNCTISYDVRFNLCSVVLPYNEHTTDTRLCVCSLNFWVSYVLAFLKVSLKLRFGFFTFWWWNFHFWKQVSDYERINVLWLCCLCWDSV